MSCISVLAFFLFLNSYNCFNLDTNFPIVWSDPFKYLNPNSNKSTYFGYSVVLYPGNSINLPWIFTSAPKGNNQHDNPTGVCFKCKIGEKCSLFDVEAFASASNRYNEKMDNAWIGSSMDINYNLERIVTCAPRWIKVRKTTNDLDYRMQGACYWFHTSDKNSTQKLIPLESDNMDIYTNDLGSVYYFGQGQAGFSVHMPPRKKEMVLGAPGVFNWDGTALLYKDSDELDPTASKYRSPDNRRKRRYAEFTEFNSKNIGNAIDTTQTLAYDLFGYSTSSGYFYHKTKLHYVSSAPRSNYQGQVLIYEFSKNSLAPLVVNEAIHGEQFGEYFGASLTAGDINGDGFDDLIVGAPFHIAQKYNEGKVYIFLGSGTGRLQAPKRDSITGKSINGQFGTALQFLGDMNHDGFGDVAVAAPYEEEKSGVVYLFRGNNNGLETTFCQRIVGKDIYENIRGFGISISRPADMDDNKYSDLAIGAHLSGHVVLLRSRPVVTIYQRLESFSSHLDYNAKQFSMTACFWARLDTLDAGNISVERTLLIDQQLSRAYLESEQPTKEILLIPNQEVCENFTIRLMDSFINHYDPISVSLSHTFHTPVENKEVLYIDSDVRGEDNNFCPRCPVYDKLNSDIFSTFKVPFSLGCKSGNRCNASLNIKPKFLGLQDDTFILGSKDYITLHTDVENLGERAYLTQLLVTVPESVTFRSNPSACTPKNTSSYLCSVANPLETDAQESVILELDMTNVNSGKFDEPLVFTVEVFTSSENDRDKVKNLTMKLKREADITIRGKSEEQSYSYRNITYGQKFTQIYQIEINGSSQLNEIAVEIMIPHTLKADNDKLVNFISLYPPVASLSGQTIICNSDFFDYIIEEKTIAEDGDLDFSDDNTRSKRSTGHVSKRAINENDAFQNRTNYINCTMNKFICSKVKCNAGPIKTGQVAKIKLKMLFNISAIKDVFGDKDVFLFATHGEVVVTNPSNFDQSGGRPDSSDATSLFIGDLKQEKVALWIIIVSAVAGLLLLLLLILGLVKAGFFKRIRKQELEQLKKEIEYSDNEHQSVDTLDTEMTLE